MPRFLPFAQGSVRFCDKPKAEQSTKINRKKSFSGLQYRLKIIKNRLLYYNFLKNEKIAA